jgi:two-component system, OmpR family, alkaline phosphatase synthesis response regulator PhoP
MNQIRILLVEGEANVHGILPDMLESISYIVESCRDGLQAQDWATAETFDLIILDTMLPSRNGFEVCRHLRRNSVDTPILMLGTSELNHKIEGFKSGSDDYLSKPFEITELQLRVEALLRRACIPAWRALNSYRLNGLYIDFINSVVSKDGKTTVLRKRECELLRCLVDRRGSMLSRDELLQAIWGYTPLLQTRIVDVHISRLRQKIEPDPKNPEYIITVHGEGYRFAQ